MAALAQKISREFLNVDFHKIPLAICNKVRYHALVRVEVNAFVVYIHLYVARNLPKILGLGDFCLKLLTEQIKVY